MREQGLRGIESEAAVTGGLGSGDRLRELTRFSQGLATQDFANQFNRLGAITGTGLSAASALGGVSGQAAAGQSQALQAAGAARAAGITGQAAGLREGVQMVGSVLASDIRLKENIVKIGEFESGLGRYSWSWKDSAKELFGHLPTSGTIAQEAKELFPDAVKSINGIFHVDYARIN